MKAERAPKHPGHTLDEWERSLKGVEDITPAVRTWTRRLLHMGLLFVWLWLMGLAIYWART